MTALESAPDHVTPYDRFAWSDALIEQWLASGAHALELGAYFGAEEYRELVQLARAAQGAALEDAALRVLIVPGIMGSQLGLRRPRPLPDDIVWLDPIDIQHGRLAALRLPEAAPVVSLGAVLYSYLRLKLRLRAHGFAAELHDYDWRQGVGTCGRSLAARLTESGRCALVAHSMGGLVARAALARPGTGHVARVILLGTPNCGSYAAVQALRGTYAVVRKVARLAGHASAESLAEQIFSTFPSLYDLLPTGLCSPGLDFLDEAVWPRAGPRPRGVLLAGAQAMPRLLAAADERFASVIGVGEETVTAAERRGEDFVYTVTRQGDGTVPAVSAALAGARSFYARVAHSDLTRDPVVTAAVADLLGRGTTRRLPQRLPPAGRAEARVSDAQLRRTHARKVDWAGLSPDARREFLQTLNEPLKLALRVPVAAGARRAR